MCSSWRQPTINFLPLYLRETKNITIARSKKKNFSARPNGQFLISPVYIRRIAYILYYACAILLSFSLSLAGIVPSDFPSIFSSFLFSSSLALLWKSRALPARVNPTIEPPDKSLRKTNFLRETVSSFNFNLC